MFWVISAFMYPACWSRANRSDASFIGSTSRQSPVPERKSGSPESVLAPAPVNTTAYRLPRRRSASSWIIATTITSPRQFAARKTATCRWLPVRPP